VAVIYGGDQAVVTERQVGRLRLIEAVPNWRRPSSLRSFWNSLRGLSPCAYYARLPDDFLYLLAQAAHRGEGSRFIYSLANDKHCNPRTSCHYKAWFHVPLFSLGLSVADAIGVQHAGQFGLLPARLRARARPIPNLINCSAAPIRSFQDADIDVLWVASIRPQKRLDLLLTLAESLPHLRFGLAGGFDSSIEAEQRSIFERRIAQIPSLTYFGPRDRRDVFSLLARSRLLLNTSDYEGFPNTMLEAWSVGVPVVSLHVDPGEVIQDKRLGCVSRSEARLKDDIGNLTGNEALNVESGARAYEYVRHSHQGDAVYRALLAAATASDR
jgi:glycosyltransferase involved in cell wall biosynthesis